MLFLAGFVVAVAISVHFILPRQIHPVERDRDLWQERAKHLQQTLDLQLPPPALPILFLTFLHRRTGVPIHGGNGLDRRLQFVFSPRLNPHAFSAYFNLNIYPNFPYTSSYSQCILSKISVWGLFFNYS